MSYRIDGEMTYWGGKKHGNPIKPASEEAVESAIKAFESFSEEVKKEKELFLRLGTEAILEDTSRNIKKALEAIEKLEQIAMEEKKTNKMTKAEAFEWLKCKKVNTIGLGKEVQKKLFDCGVKWHSGKCEYYDFSDYLLIEYDGDLYHCGNCGESYWRMHHFEEISADDILSIEIVDEKKEETENINIELEKWIEIVRNKFCRKGWSFVISASNFALISGDLIEEKRIKD